MNEYVGQVYVAINKILGCFAQLVDVPEYVLVSNFYCALDNALILLCVASGIVENN